MLKLRDYQQNLKNGINAAWASGLRNVLGVLPCGGGKTAVFSNIIAEEPGASVAIAHRSELVIQMSLALARNGVRHNIIGPDALVRAIVTCHKQMVGHSHYAQNARCAVAAVNTLVNREATDPWFRQVALWVTDEAHHLCVKNIWGRAAAMFPNARGLGVTATPIRADGKGLGRHADGVFDQIVVGPGMRELINAGYLSPYRVFLPPSDIDLSNVPVTAGGDYSLDPLRKAVHSSHIVGDVVAHYLRVAAGKLGITFAVDIESATELAAAYRCAGVAAEVLTGKTPMSLRYAIQRRFAAGDVKQICACDLVSEGYDLPSLEVASFARPTQSYGLFVQQWGRAIRPLEGKSHAIILDHVGNTLRHGLPDAPRTWSLDRRERRSRGAPPNVIPLRSCPQCAGAYERVYAACPYCGFVPVPAGRSSPEEVDGDLAELDPQVLEFLRGEIVKTESGFVPVPAGASAEVIGACHKRHRERQEAQAALRTSMMLWGGYQQHLGRENNEAQRRFYFRYGIDVANAQLLGRADADALRERIDADLTGLLTGATVTSTLPSPLT